MLFFYERKVYVFKNERNIMHEIILSGDIVCDGRVCLYKPYKRPIQSIRTQLHTNVKRMYMLANMNHSI